MIFIPMSLNVRNTFRNLLSLFLCGILVYQTFDLFENYLNYPTVQSINILSRAPRGPISVSICDQNYRKVVLFVLGSKCILTSYERENFNFDRLQQPFYSVGSLLYCATYLSQLPSKEIEIELNGNGKELIGNGKELIKKESKLFEKEKEFIKEKELIERKPIFIVRFNTQFEVGFSAIHSQLSPPQLFEKLPMGCMAQFNVEAINSILMPSPYDTECFEYNLKSVKSKEDCIYQCSFNNKDTSELYSLNRTIFETWVLRLLKFGKFKSKKECKNACAKNCEMQHFWASERGSLENCGIFSILKGSKYLYQRTDVELLMIHKEAFTSLFLAVQLDGLVSLWFGLSIKDVSEFTFEKILFIRKYFSKFLSFLYYFICFYQIFLISIYYFKFETKTKTIIEISYEIEGVFPKMEFLVYKGLLDIRENGEVGHFFKKLETKNWKNQNNRSRITSLAYKEEIRSIGKAQRIAFGYERSGTKEVNFEFDETSIRFQSSSVNLVLSFS